MVKQQQRRQTGASPAADNIARAEPRSGIVRAAIALAIIAAAVWLVFGRSQDAPFIYDDSTSIVYNRSIQRLFPLGGDEDSPGPLRPPRDSSVAGRPTTNLTFALNYRFGQLNPRGYHLVNVALHMLAACLLWGIVRHTVSRYVGGEYGVAADALAFCAAMLWALHPLQTEAVQYLAQRTELLMGVCYLATMFASMQYWHANTSRRQDLWLGLAVATCALGMGSKEVMVSAPLVVLLFDRTFVSGSFRSAIGKSWPLYLGLAATWSILVYLNWHATRSQTAGFQLDVPAHVWWFTQCKVLWLYLKLVVGPWPLVIHYEIPLIESWRAAAPWIVCTGMLLTFSLVQLYRRTASGFLWSTVLLVLAPTLIVPIVTEVAAERRMYLPLAALVSFFVAGAYRLVRHAHSRPADGVKSARTTQSAAKLVACVCAGVAILYVVLDVRRLDVYQDEVTLWQDTARHVPESALVHMNLGLALINAGRAEEAIEQYKYLLKLEPENAVAHHNNLAYAYLRAGRASEAIDELREALRLDENSVEAHNNLATALTSANQPAEAIEHFRAVVRLKPDYAEGHLGLGSALSAVGDYSAAVEQFEEFRRARPASIEAHSHLAKTYAELGDATAARAAAVQAILLARSQGQTEVARQIEAWLATQPQSPR